ncbi:phosphopantothenate--cysteine ligase-like [Ruditapes philippinarum]|uniref:phosphopantothenate--cysteine ligase-like n=1 Tax=Ruditapes philippinarum TaxID=129788 RepID=UPI00295B3F14|nr:phosphopantothenate--cysteine ligase-like [Ruditapes philippinarum]
MAEAAKFFEETSEPANFFEKKSQIENFVAKHNEESTPVVLVTSGGTTVPLEGNTVRYIDNFSIGTRGSASAEYFLEHGYAVLFLHRQRSLQPFTRHLPQSHLLDILEVKGDNEGPTLCVKQESTSKLLNIIQKYHAVQQEGRLLMIEFTTLVDYLHLLRASSLILSTLGKKASLYLAAAVSDFYIPKNKMPQHKIQSSNGPLQLSLELVPKMLEALVKNWVSSAFVVSFKLETDPNLLTVKAQQSLEKYEHQLVIGNILDTRKYEVVFVTNSDIDWIKLDDKDIQNGVEIESKIVKNIVERHRQFCCE